MTEIILRDNSFKLLPQKALLWNEKRTLILSDIHIGKIMHFRKEGIAVPGAAINENFRKLDSILSRHEVDRILFLGDLFHSELNSEWEVFASWRRKYNGIKMDIILGNHDRLPYILYEEVKLCLHVNNLMEGPFVFSHYPETQPSDLYIISGHVHPVIHLGGRAGEYFRLPCFYFSECQAILPCFGYFTGGYPIQPGEGDNVYAVANEKIFDVSPFYSRV